MKIKNDYYYDDDDDNPDISVHVSTPGPHVAYSTV